jgi:hypothetical protein
MAKQGIQWGVPEAGPVWVDRGTREGLTWRTAWNFILWVLGPQEFQSRPEVWAEDGVGTGSNSFPGPERRDPCLAVPGQFFSRRAQGC